MNHRPHFHIEGALPLLVNVTVDGEPFPWPIRHIAWGIDSADPDFPTLTFTVDAGRITIDQDTARLPVASADTEEDA